MPDASFEIARGHVEIDADVDKKSVRGAADDATDGVERGLRGRRSKGRIARAFSAMFTANPALLSALRTGIPAVLASPVGIAAAALAVTFAGSFLAAVASIGVGIIPPLLFAGIGAFALKENEKIRAAFTETGTRVADVFRDAAKPLVGPFVDALTMVGDSVEKLAPTFEKIFEDIAPAIEPLTGGLLGLAENLVAALGDQMPDFVDILVVFAEELPRLGTSLGQFFKVFADNKDTIMTAIGPVISIVGILLGLLAELLVQGTRAFNALVIAWHGLEDGIKAAIGWITGTAVPAVVGAFEAVVGWGRAAVDGIRSAWGSVVGFFAGIGSAIGSFVSGVVGWFQALPGRAMGFIKSLPKRVNQLFLTMFDMVTRGIGLGIGTVVGLFIELPRRVGRAARALPGVVADLFRNVRERMRDITRSAINAVVDFFRNLPGRVHNAARAIVSRVAGIFNGARSEARSGARSLVNGAVDILRNLPGRAARAVRAVGSRVASAIRGQASSVYSAGQALIRALINGVGSLVSWATGMARRAIDNIVGGIKDALPGSPVRRGPLTVLNNGYAGRQIVRMITEGMNDEAARLRAGFGDVLAAASTPVTRPAPAPAAGPTYNFGPGSVVLDASRLRSIEDLMRLLDDLRMTARQYGARVVTP